MSNRKDHETMMKLDSCYKLVQQSSAKGGIKAVEIAEKLDAHKTTVYKHLNSLELMGKVYSDQGLWKATKEEEQTIKPLEKEVKIILPIEKKQFEGVLGIKLLSKHLKNSNLLKPAELFDIMMETFDETRTITIKGKNVDDIELTKMVELIKEANEKNSKVNLKGALKKFKF